MKVVVVSPHLDDAVLSIGATLHALAQSGADVRVVTVFAGDPERSTPPSYWDAERGVDSAAAATSLRREEDLAASRVLGYEPVWLSFDDNGYVYHRDPRQILAAIEPHIAPATLVLIPGWPLVHADHRYTAMMMLEHMGDKAMLLYSELPYAATPRNLALATVRGRTSTPLRLAVDDHVEWASAVTTSADRAAKRAAIACYGGELMALGYRARLSATYERLVGRELFGRRRSVVVPEWFPLG